MRRYHEDESSLSETTLDEQDQQMLDEVIRRGRRRWRVKVRYEARLRSLEWQVADLKDEVRRLRG